MQRFLSALGQFCKTILILGTISLITLSGLFVFVEQPSLAAPVSAGGEKLIQQEQQDKESEAANLREQNYEEQVKASGNIDKVYEKNLKTYEKENPGEGLIEKTVEGAEKLVDKVTGK